MINATATLSDQNQITVPLKVRELLGLKKKEKIVFQTTDNGKVFVEKAVDWDDRLAQIHEVVKPYLRPEDTGKTANQLIDEYLNTPEGQKELRRMNYGG
jgi:AbrB family looped-hinge helix DNA binding protein